MGADQHLDWRGADRRAEDGAAAASLLDWWVEAGVDMVVDEGARDWLAPAPAPAPAVAASAPIPAAAMLAADEPPAGWDAYAGWRIGPQAPEHGWSGGWIAAAGPARPALMVLTDCPDRDDLAAGALLSGEAGRLFDRMLAAIGLARADVHLAALCAKRPTAGRIPADAERRLAALARHHHDLIGPRALLILGNATSRALLAADLTEARGRLHVLNHSGGETGAGQARVVASYHPRFLLEKPVAKAGAWADLQALKRVMGE